MGFSFDIYGNLKQPKMFLYNSKTNPVGTIIGAENIKLEQNFHKLFELNFKIYKNVNNEETEFYDKIIKNKLIEMQYINWFQILSAVEKYDDTAKETYKEVKCCPLENSLIYRKVHNINGVFGLWDITDTSKSLLHIISAECGWNVGHISNSLLTKFRTFNIDSMEIYNLMTTKLQDSFGCIFQFDSYTKTINAYLLSELNELTDIVISKKNVLREYIKDDSESAIITKMRVKGGDDGNGNQVDIRAVNFGRNYIINLDYYMTTEWVSQSLVDTYITYKTACDNARTSFNQSLATLKTKNAELTTLKISLADLKSLKLAQEDVIGVSVSNHGRVPIPTDTDYSIYQNAVTLVNTYLSQITAKESEITVKENEIATVQSTLDSISNSIDESNYFTSEQIAEMNNFITEGEDFEDSSYVITSETTEEEALEIQTELMQSADENLAIKSKPNYTFDIKASSLYTIQDDKDELIPYSDWKTQLNVGSLITLFIDSTWMTVRLMSIIIDFDNPEEIELKFSTKNRLDDELTQLAEIIADSGRASSTLSLKQLGYDEASKLVNPVREFINGTLSATLNAFQSNDNQEMLYDKFGLHGKKWLPDQNKYSDNQLWINNNGLLLTSDGWKTSSTALGLLTLPDGTQKYGLSTDVIFGDFVLTSALTISNPSNTITMNKDGATFKDCDITINKGTNTLKLNATDGIKLTNNGVSQFYIDGSGNAVFGGSLSAATGTFSGLISGGSININNKFLVDSQGNATLTSGTLTGVVINSVGTNANLTIENGNMLVSGYNGYLRAKLSGDSGYTKLIGLSNLGNIIIGHDNSVYSEYGGYSRDINMYASNINIKADSSGNYAYVNITGGALINNNTVLHTGNIGSQTVGYANTSFGVSAGSWLGLFRISPGGGYISYNDWADNTMGYVYIGSMNIKCNDLYTHDGSVNVSDVRRKTNLVTMTDKQFNFFKSLIPYTFEFTDGTSGRTHYGFSAQQVKEAMDINNISDLEFAGFIKSPIYELKDENGEPDTTSNIIDYTYGLRYTEFISLLTYVMQRQQIEIDSIKEILSRNNIS